MLSDDELRQLSQRAMGLLLRSTVGSNHSDLLVELALLVGVLPQVVNDLQQVRSDWRRSQLGFERSKAFYLEVAQKTGIWADDDPEAPPAELEAPPR
jgi:hypothetical protein